MKHLLRFCSGLTLLMFFGLGTLNAQVTTSSMSGTVVDNDGNPLPGATVLATHEPTGTKYGVVTRANGRYNLANLRVGGPYKVEATFVGFEAQVKQGYMLTLGKNQTINFEREGIAIQFCNDFVVFIKGSGIYQNMGIV